MLIAGVAFQHPQDTKTWQVFSHEGDELGTLSTGVVEQMRIHFRQHGYRWERITRIHAGENDSVTFGFNARISERMMETLIKRRTANYATIH